MAKEAQKTKISKKTGASGSKKLVKTRVKKDPKPNTEPKPKPKVEKVEPKPKPKVEKTEELETKDVAEPKVVVPKKPRKFNNKPVLATTTGINISPAKVKNIVSNNVLNRDACKAITEIKNARPHTKKTTVDKKEVIQHITGTPVNKLSNETTAYIKYAINEFEKSHKAYYSKTKVSKMNDDDKLAYNTAKSTANKQFLHDSKFDLDAFNLSYDPHFYDKYNQDKKIVDDANTDDEWKKAIDKVAKLKNRFSTNSRVFLSAFVEYFIKQLTLNGTMACVAEGKKIIQLSHILGDAHGQNTETFSLHPFIVNLDTFKQARAHVDKANKSPKNPADSAEESEDEHDEYEEKTEDKPTEKNKVEKCTDLFKLDGISLDKQYQFRYYISETCREVRMDLAKSDKNADGNQMSVYNYTSVSKIFKNFCSTLVCEFLMRIGEMLKKEIETRGIKTVNDTIIETVIYHYHKACGVDEKPTFNFIKEVTDKYYGYVNERQDKRTKENESAGDMTYSE